MNLKLIIVQTLLIVAALYTTQIYNLLVRLKYNVARAWSNLDVALKHHDKLPKLVEICKQSMGYEQDTLERVVRALGLAETELRAGLGSLFALAENYPELRANDSFRHLAERVSQLEIEEILV